MTRIPPGLLNDAATTTTAMTLSRLDALTAAVHAIRSMESEIRKALAGEVLQGMPNLASSRTPFRAVRVRSKKLDESLRVGKPTLCLTLSGELVLAQLEEGGHVSEEPADSGTFTVDDVEAVAEAAINVLEGHVKAGGRAGAKYDELKQLAERIAAALEEEWISTSTRAALVAARHQLVAAFGIVRSHASDEHVQNYQRAIMLCDAALSEAREEAPEEPSEE